MTQKDTVLAKLNEEGFQKEHPNGVRSMILAKACGLPNPTVGRILCELKDAGTVEKTKLENKSVYKVLTK